MPPGLPGLVAVGSLKGEPGLFAELPGVVSPRSWQDWLGGPGGPGGLSARAGPASPSEKQAVIRAINNDLRMTFLLLSSGAPTAQRGIRGKEYTPPSRHETLRHPLHALIVPGPGCQARWSGCDGSQRLAQLFAAGSADLAGHSVPRDENPICKQGVSCTTYSAKVQQRPLTAASEHGHRHTKLPATTDKRPEAPLV